MGYFTVRLLSWAALSVVAAAMLGYIAWGVATGRLGRGPGAPESPDEL